MKVIFVALAYTLFFIAVELITKKTKISKEISRKTVHLLAGVSAAFLPFLMSFNEIIILSLLFIPVMLYSKKVNIFSSIHDVKRKTYGEVYFPFAILITALVFPDKILYAYGLLIMAVSDCVASIIGQKWGGHKYSLFSGRKSYEGSISFFVCSFLIGVGVMLAVSVGIIPTIFFSVILAGLLTLVEAGLSDGLDNLVLPPLASGLLFILVSIFSL